MEIAQRQLDHDDQRGLRRQRARPVAEGSRTSAATRASRPSCGSTRCCATGRRRRSCSASGAIAATARNRAATAIEAAQKFLRDWIDRQKAIYLAVSLPPEFRYPADPARRRRPGGADDAGEGRPAGLRGAEPAVRDDDRLAPAGEPGAARRRRHGRAGRRAVGREPVPRVPEQPVLRDDARPREPARAVRGRAEVRQPDGLRLLVVPEQPER